MLYKFSYAWPYNMGVATPGKVLLPPTRGDLFWDVTTCLI